MADIFSKKKRGDLMANIKSKNTKLEINFLKAVSSELYPLGYRYRKHYRSLYGNPDIVFVKQKIAVFVDSEFWHGYRFEKNKKALKTHFWLSKIERNIIRDKKVNKVLKNLGWKVLRIWGKETKEQPQIAVLKILKLLTSYTYGRSKEKVNRSFYQKNR